MDRLHHAVQKFRLGTVNPELHARHRLANPRDRVDREIHAVSLDQRSVVHDHEGSARRVARWSLETRRLKHEDLVVGGIHDNANLLRAAAARDEQLLAREIDGERQIRQLDAPLLEPLERPHPQAVSIKVENRHHQFGHRIVEVENHLGSECLGDQRAQDEDVGHVVHVDKVVAPGQRAHGEDARASQDKGHVLKHIAEGAGAAALERNTEDIHAAEGLGLRIPLAALEADDVDVHPLVTKRLCGSTRSGIHEVVREHHHGDALSPKARGATWQPTRRGDRRSDPHYDVKPVRRWVCPSGRLGRPSSGWTT